MSIGGIYIGPRILITFGAELLWLGLSTVLLVIVNCASLGEPLTFSALLFQTFSVVFLYMAIFYVMDLYDPAFMGFTGTLLLNLVQAIGIFLVIVGVVMADSCFESGSASDVRAHASDRDIRGLLPGWRSNIPPVRVNPTSRFGVVARDPLRNELSAENELRKDLGLDFLWIGDSLEKAHAALVRIEESHSIFAKY